MTATNKAVVYTTDDAGQAFATGRIVFPEISTEAPVVKAPDPRRFQVELTSDEVRLAASATPVDADFAHNSGEFVPASDMDVEGLGARAEIPAAFDDEGGPEAFTGFDPDRADALVDELGEDLITRAKTVARTLGADATPEEFLAAMNAAPALTDEDRDVLDRTRRLGALAVLPVEHAAPVGRLADAHEAHLRLVDGELLLVPVGVSSVAVLEAAQRSRSARVGEAARLEGESILATATEYLSRMGAASLDAVLGRIGGDHDAVKGHLRSAVRIGALAFKEVSTPRGASLAPLLGSGGTDQATFARAHGRSQRVVKDSFSNMKESARRARARGSKAFPAPVVPFGGKRVDPKLLPELLEVETLRARYAENAPAGLYGVSMTRGTRNYVLFGGEVRTMSDSYADDPNDELPNVERESGPNPYGERVSAMEAERAGEAIIGTASGTVPGAPRRAGQREGAVRRVNRAVAKVAARDLGAGRDPVAAAKARACKGAWNAALATRLSELDGADRLELLLRTRGETDFALLLARAGDPTSLKAAARELLDAGRIAVREVGGAHLVSAIRVLDAAGREELSRELLRIMVTSRVTVPKGTKLARRVAAHKGHLKYGTNARRFMAFPNGNPNGAGE